MRKPEKKQQPACYDYHEMIEYIEDKYGIETRSYKKADGKIEDFRDFWHWVLQSGSIHNGCYAHFQEDWDHEDTPDWVREIMRFIVDEFYPNGEDLVFWVDW